MRQIEVLDVFKCPGSVHHTGAALKCEWQRNGNLFLSVTLIPAMWPLLKPDVFAYSALEDAEKSSINLQQAGLARSLPSMVY